jgi:hypothetical protein
MWSIPSYLLLWTQALNLGIVFECLTLMFCVKKYLAKFSEPLKYSWLQCLLKSVMPNATFIPSLTTTFSYTPVDHWTLSCSSRSLREPNTGPCFISPVVGTHRFVSQNSWLLPFIIRLHNSRRRIWLGIFCSIRILLRCFYLFIYSVFFVYFQFI